MIHQVTGVKVGEVYNEDTHDNLGRYLEKDGLTYQFVKVAAGTKLDKGAAIVITPLYVASETTVVPIQGVAVCYVDAYDADKYTLVITDIARGATAWVNVNPGSNTALSAESWDGIRLSCFNSAAQGSCFSGKLFTAATAALVSTTATGADITAYTLNTDIATLNSNLTIQEKCNVVAVSAGSAFTADSATVSGRLTWAPYYMTAAGSIYLTQVSADLPTGASALLASADFQVGDIITEGGVNRTVTAVSGLSAFLTSAFPATGRLTATASGFTASGGALYFVVNKYRIRARFK